MRQLAFALIILISFSSHAQMCVDLFTIDQQVKNLDEYSMRRFEPSIDKTPAITPAHIYWRQRVGKPIFRFQNMIRLNTTTHMSLHISPKHDYVVSMGSDKVVRIIEVSSGKIISSIKSSENIEIMNTDDFRVVAVTDSHFVLATESSWHHSKYMEIGLSMFRPGKLSAIDFRGNILGSYSSELAIKGSVYLENSKTWIVADQLSVATIKLEEGKQQHSSFSITPLLRDSLNRHRYVSALGLSRDGTTLYVAMSKKRHNDLNSELLTIDISNLKRPLLSNTKNVDLSQVYSIRQRTDGALILRGSLAADLTSDPMVEIIVE